MAVTSLRSKNLFFEAASEPEPEPEVPAAQLIGVAQSVEPAGGDQFYS